MDYPKADYNSRHNPQPPQPINLASRQRLIKEIQTLLGGDLIDPEETIISYNLAVDMALDRYRQRSSNATEESALFLTLVLDENVYTLPQEVIEVRKIYRRNFGLGAVYGSSGQEQRNNGMPGQDANTTGSSLDPFDSYLVNSMLLSAQSGSGGLLSWNLWSQYALEVGKMFGLEIIFYWNTDTKKLVLQRRPRSQGEEVLLHVYNYKTENSLIDGLYSKPWIRNYALAQTKLIIGQAYSRYSTLPGPSGGITLNGPALISEATAEMEKLDKEILDFMTGETPFGIIRG